MKKQYALLLIVLCFAGQAEAQQSDKYLYQQRIAVFDPAGLSDTATMSFYIDAFDPDGDTLEFKAITGFEFMGLLCDTLSIIKVDSVFKEDSIQVWVPNNYWVYDTTKYLLVPHCEYDTIPQ